MKHYYKIIFGYGDADYIGITENELPKAIWLFKQGSSRAVFENGAVRGQDIMRIVPDWHTAKGWNKGWKMTADDYADVRNLEDGYKQVYSQANLIADFASNEKRLDVLNLPFQEALQIAPQEEQKAISDGVKSLAAKMQM